jgi:hypothetical protein
VGFKKKPSVITHYAVKLSAKANILFSPFIGDLTLTAYSAAKPFGSRIGDPDFDPATLTHVGSNPDFCDPTATGLSEPNCIGKIPNLPFVVGEVATGNNWGWNRLRRQHAMYRNLIERNSQGSPGGTDIKIPALNRGYEAAMAPNPIEAGKYNILINDTQSASSNWKECNPLKPGLAFQCDFFSEHFNENGAYSIWAPIFPPNDRDPEKMKATLKDFFKTFEDRQGTLKAVFNDAFKDALIQSMVKYVQGIENGPDPSGNSINILKIKDPFNHHVEGGEIEPITFAGDPSLLLDPSSPQNFKTSWNANRDQNWNRTGRIGYSVKFVSFNSLATSAGATNTGGVATGLDGIQH